jgi:hypothetical protein
MIKKTVVKIGFSAHWIFNFFAKQQGGHFVFIDNPTGFHSAVFYACRRYISPKPENERLPEGLTFA